MRMLLPRYEMKDFGPRAFVAAHDPFQMAQVFFSASLFESLQQNAPSRRSGARWRS